MKEMTLETIKQTAEPLLKQYPVTYAGVFGSFARGKENSESDVDIMIEYKRPFSLLRLIQLEQELSTALGKKVDLVTERGANKYMRSSMLADLKVFYGTR